MPFTRELAAQVARSPSGQAAVYPVVRTVQTDGICTEVVAPCPGLTDEHALAAQQVALRIAEALDVVGMLAVELFDTPDGRARQRAGDAPAQQRALVASRARSPASSRTTCARCSTCRWGHRRPARRTR